MSSKEETISAQWKTAWDALQPIRATWDEKEKSLLAQTNDSFSGAATYSKVTDAALSTLSFERQARVAAQLPTGRVIAQSKSKQAAAKVLNVVLNRYITKKADSQHPLLIKLRLRGVYASVYGSMPMFYDYRVDDRYIGPDCYLVDPRSFAIQPGVSSIQDADYAFISTIVTVNYLKAIAKRDKTTWNKGALRRIIKQAEDRKAKPGRDNDSQKESVVERERYDKTSANGRIELVTKYESGENGHWITFAPDFDNAIVRDIPNPHKSGRIPIVMRHCFPLLNSIFGLGDYERGMRIQKAKDSLTNLFIEGAKNRVFPPLKINRSEVTLSTIKNQANSRWFVTDMNNSVQPVNYGANSLNEYQATWGSLQSMLMNQFGTTDTTQSQQDTGNPAYGKTPQALQLLQQRQNARDTWDMFMHEQATEELYEGMINLLTKKMEKPINFAVFEEDIAQIAEEFEGQGLDIFDGGQEGRMTLAKKQVAGEYEYQIDPNSSMSQNAQERFQALSETWGLVHSDPNIMAAINQGGYTYDEAEHLKSLFVSAGVNDWDKILRQKSDEEMQEQEMQQQMAMQQGMMPQEPGQQMPPQEPMQPDQGMQPQQFDQSQFDDPEIQAVAAQLLNGGM